MKIRSMTWQAFRVPFARPLDDAHPDRFGVVLRVETDGGITGLGEASPPGFGSPEALEDVERGLRDASGALRSLDLNEASPVPALPATLPGPVRFGLETALGDVLGKATGRPLAEVIGGGVRRLPANALITARDPEGAARQADEARALGITTLKIKVARLPADAEVEILRALREAAGPDGKIRIDAKGAWTATSAPALLSRFEPLGIEYCEQPVPPGDVAEMARVRRESPIPIAADESITGWDAARRLKEAGAADLFIVKAARTGFAETLKILAESRKRGWKVVLTTSLESGTGVAASLHLASLTPHDTPSGLATLPLLEDDLILEDVEIRDGCIDVPPGHGLGTTLDEEALRRYGIAPRGEMTL